MEKHELDLDQRIEKIADSLRTAFGGASQLTHDIVGKAIAGQIMGTDISLYMSVDSLCEAVVHKLYVDVDWILLPLHGVVHECNLWLKEKQHEVIVAKGWPLDADQSE